jgi:hypothetical protein
MDFIQNLALLQGQYQNSRNGVKALGDLEINPAWPHPIPLSAPQKNQTSLEQGNAHEYIL